MSSPNRPRCWLVMSGGARILVQDRGLVLGRLPSCDVVLSDPHASSRHAVITPTVNGLELVALGRNPTSVNGAPVDRNALLENGDVLELPGATFTVDVDRSTSWSRQAWVVELPDGSWYAIRQLPFIVGGGRSDHLEVPGWPERLLTFHLVQGELAVELGADAELCGEPIPEGAVELVEPRDEVRSGGTTVRFLLADGSDGDSTKIDAGASLPTSARFEFLPNGGRLHLHFGPDAEVVVELSELRARLVASLLDPPGEYQAGDFLPDEVLIPSIWSRGSSRGRTDLNLLVHRTRKNLLDAGINPVAVLVRARKGGATSFRLAPGAEVAVG